VNATARGTVVASATRSAARRPRDTGGALVVRHTGRMSDATVVAQLTILAAAGQVEAKSAMALGTDALRAAQCRARAATGQVTMLTAMRLAPEALPPGF
jgi:hypothetical protein